jgi:hypothetical protein
MEGWGDAAALCRELEAIVIEVRSYIKAEGLTYGEDKTTRFTEVFRSAFSQAGEKRGFTARHKGSGGKGEYLWDLCWLKGKRAPGAPVMTFADLILTLECEWHRPLAIEVERDFYKIVDARAPLKVMIFAFETKKLVGASWEDLKKRMLMLARGCYALLRPE